ncbi:MAG: ABC transporter ATP-binding protein [Verrucomicrobiales bacterium]|jgi:ABC-2 type transport system ATP-binding protein|nr:ABC transporter ATP-binding protein [Verrucomicrobiales bacterium]
MNEQDFAVGASGLTKTFTLEWTRKKLLALDGLDMQVRRGEVFGLLGPNGSGKSTTMKLILGLIRPTSGMIKVFGEPSGSLASRRQLGFLPENPYFPGFLSAREVLNYYGKLVDLCGKQLRERVEELIELVGLPLAADRALKTYSKGMLQRIGLAQALLHDPDLLLLDEPTAGVDPIGSRQIRDLILALKKRGKTIIFSSHLLEQVQEVSDRVIILHRGKKMQEGTLDELLSVQGQSQFTVSGLTPELQEKVAALLKSEGAELVNVSHPKQKLEDYFIRSVSK